jgi:S1-C subfamily serine protease
LFRAGRERAVLVALGALPSAAKGASRKDQPGRDELQPLGLKLRDPTPEVRRKLRLAPDRGAIVVRVAPKSIGSEKDVRDGDVLVEIGGKAVRSAEHAHRLLSKAQLRRGVRVWLKRGAYGHFVVLKQPL